MRHSLLLAAVTILISAPAVADDPPTFRKPPAYGPVSGSVTCVQGGRYVEDGAVRRERRRGDWATPLPVPTDEQVQGTASETVSRPVIRSFLQLRIGAEAETLPEAAAGLATRRDALVRAIEAGGHAVLETLVLHAQMSAPVVGRRPAGGSARIGLLVEGALDRAVVGALLDAQSGDAVERLEYDLAHPDALAEDLRAELQRRAREDAAAQAAMQGTVLAELLSSDLVRSRIRPAGDDVGPEEITVTARAKFRMVPETAAGSQ